MRPLLKVRAALLALATAGLGLLPAPARADTFPDPPTVVQVVAHADDTFLFFNPDLRKVYSFPLVTVFLTAGAATTQVGPGEPFADTCLYGESRDMGARAGAAEIAGVANPTWTRTPITFAGKVAEEDTLVQAPQVKLVFFKLHDAGDANFIGGKNSQTTLQDLYQRGQITGWHQSTMGTLAADGGSDCEAQYANQTYTKAQLTASLTALYAHYNATVVYGMDPHRFASDPGNTDHLGAGGFTLDSVAAYHGPGNDGHVLLRPYRDYNVSFEESDLDSADATQKNNDFLAYLGPNRGDIPGVYHGLYDTSPDPNDTFYPPFYSRQYSRWPNGSVWTKVDGTGKLNAFAILNSQIEQWTETAPGGSWTGPTPIPGSSGLTPTLAVTVDPTGLLRVFTTRLSDYAVVTDVQTAPGVWGGWTSLGNPNSSNPTEVGDPAALTEQNGNVTVFVRNLGTGVSAKTLNPGSSWPSAWADLGGFQIRDDLSVGLDGSGAGELFAPSENGILHWKQNAARLWAGDSSPLTPAAIGKTQVSSALNADGRQEIFYADPDNPTVATQWTQSNGSWTTTPGLLGGSPPMLESVAAATGGDGRISIAIRNSGGGVSMVSQTGPNVGFSGTWPDLGNVIVGAPAMALDSDGRLVVLAFELDGALHIDRQTAAGTDSPFGGWQLAGA
ncbi:PIG-L family deacetylase [Catenulispora sp. NL8]|uniref:PIG-L family deacetylase n=1 Tax=Catenulispora pinistramenti TaxID=2705254 RepID=A0ABS5KLX8_9ACTN|nr:PIG-L family deacetylase [Catenulispora pinistramenti]MBS2547040.1 PIG-L family deacetylase [Catenulispora pinistramenti]